MSLNDFTIKKLQVPENVATWIEQLSGRQAEDDRSIQMARSAQMIQEEKQCIWFAQDNDSQIIGTVSLVWQSEYPFFKIHHLPEIIDLYVVPESRRNGVARTLIRAVIKECQERQLKGAGLTVEVTADISGPAHHFYSQLGFALDGQGLWHDGQQVKGDDTLTISDKTLLGLVKWF